MQKPIIVCESNKFEFYKCLYFQIIFNYIYIYIVELSKLSAAKGFPVCLTQLVRFWRARLYNRIIITEGRAFSAGETVIWMNFLSLNNLDVNISFSSCRQSLSLMVQGNMGMFHSKIMFIGKSYQS